MTTSAAGEHVKPRAARRPQAEVRADIVRAASELFAERGYSRTTTREIAIRSGVNEAILFRHFGSKAGVFSQVVTSELEDLAAELLQRTSVQDAVDAGLDVSLRRFLSSLYSVLLANRELIMALLVAEAYDDDIEHGIRSIAGITSFLDHLEARTKVHRQQRAAMPGHVDAALLGRFSFALVLAVVLYGEWLLPPQLAGDDARLVEQLAAFVIDAAFYDTGF